MSEDVLRLVLAVALVVGFARSGSAQASLQVADSHTNPIAGEIENKLQEALKAPPASSNLSFLLGGLRFDTLHNPNKIGVVLEISNQGLTTRDVSPPSVETKPAGSAVKPSGVAEPDAAQATAPLLREGHVSTLALIKDANGEVVRKLTTDVPFQVANLKSFSTAVTILTQWTDLPPGRYRMEAAIIDRISQNICARNVLLVVPGAATSRMTGVGLSSVVLVRKVEAMAGDRDLKDPFQFLGSSVTPELEERIAASPMADISLFFVVYPDQSIRPADKPGDSQPTVFMELLREGEVIARTQLPIPPPDETGTIPYVASTGLAKFQPGRYQVRITAVQNRTDAQGGVSFNLQPASD